MNLAETIGTPFYYDYYLGWRNIFLNWHSFLIMVTVLMCVFIAPVFSNESPTHVNMILYSSYYGRSNVFYCKGMAAFTLSSVIYIAAVIMFTGGTLLLYSPYGWNSSIQTVILLIPYHLNVLQAYFIIAANSYLAYIAVMSMVLLVSSLSKSNFQSIIISLSLFFVPIIIPSSANRTIDKISDLFPIKMMNGFQSIRRYNVYCLGSFVIPQHYFVPVIALVFISGMLVSAYFVNKNHHIEETN